MGLFDSLLGKSKPRILVADDDPDVRNLVKDLLTIEGFDVETAEDGLEAMALLKKHKFALLISDVHMPRMEGPQLLKVIRATAEGKTQPVIMLSSEGMIGTVNEVFEMGALAYLPTPFQPAQLLEKVHAVISKRPA